MESALATWDEINQSVAAGTKKRFTREELPFATLLLQSPPYKMDDSESDLTLVEYASAWSELRFFTMPIGWNEHLRELAKSQNAELFDECV